MLPAGQAPAGPGPQGHSTRQIFLPIIGRRRSCGWPDQAPEQLSSGGLGCPDRCNVAVPPVPSPAPGWSKFRDVDCIYRRRPLPVVGAKNRANTTDCGHWSRWNSHVTNIWRNAYPEIPPETTSPAYPMPLECSGTGRDWEGNLAGHGGQCGRSSRRMPAPTKPPREEYMILLGRVVLLRMGGRLASGSQRGNGIAHRARSRTQLEEPVQSSRFWRGCLPKSRTTAGKPSTGKPASASACPGAGRTPSTPVPTQTPSSPAESVTPLLDR